MSRGKYIFAFSVLIVLVWTCYYKTFDASWHYDDAINIPLNNNVHLEKLTWENVGKTLFAGNGKGDVYHPSSYRPTAMFSFGLNWYFGKYHVFGYHVVNLIIHFFSGIFLFLLLQKTLQLPILKDRYGEDAYSIAIVSTCLWLIHPFHVQAVTYIVQRMASMAGMFFLLSIYLYVKARTERKLVYFLGCFIAMVLSIGSKENAIILPFVIMLYDLFFIGGLNRSNLKRYALIFISFIGIAVFFTWFLAGWETFSIDTLMTGFGRREFTLPERLMTESRIMWFYLSLLFWPMSHRLFLLYDMPLSTGLFNPLTTIISIVCIFLIIGVAIWKAKKYPLISFSVIFFFLNHLIEGSIFPLELIYIHRNYIPTMFALVPLAILIVKGIKLIRLPYKYLFVSFGMAMMILFGANTFDQNSIWRRDFYLWVHQVQGNPTPRGFYNLATAYYAKGDFVNMKKYYEIVIKYDDMFGTNHSKDRKSLPFGRTHYQALKNVQMLEFMNRPGGEEAFKSFYKFLKRTPKDNRMLIHKDLKSANGG